MANYKAKQNQGYDRDDRDDRITFFGVVTQVLPGTLFKIKTDEGPEILAGVCGRIRLNKIRILLGDRVSVTVSPYDLTRGRIMSRL